MNTITCFSWKNKKNSSTLRLKKKKNALSGAISATVLNGTLSVTFI